MLFVCRSHTKPGSTATEDDLDSPIPSTSVDEVTQAEEGARTCLAEGCPSQNKTFTSAKYYKRHIK